MTTLDDNNGPDRSDAEPEATDLLPTGDREAPVSEPEPDESAPAADLLPTGDAEVVATDVEAAAAAGAADRMPTGERDESPGDEADDDADDDLEVLDEDALLDEDTEEEAPPPRESPYDRPGRWYVVHTQSGYENKVRQNLEARIASMNMEGRIFEIVIPMEDVVEFKNGKKVTVQKKMFPGYLLVRCRLDDDSWYVIRNTPGIVNFVGAGGKPSPLSRREVETFLQVEVPGVEEPQKKSKARFEFDQGETVRVKEGPFADFSGEIVEINEDQLKVKVLVNIFGRETPVELEFAQVARL